MPTRKVLVGVSILGHAALFSGVYVASAWRLEQLDYESRSRVTIAAFSAPAGEAGAAVIDAPKQEMRRKAPKVVKETVQPVPRERLRVEPVAPTGGGGGGGSGPGTGGTGTGTGACEGVMCAPEPPVVAVELPPVVAELPPPPAPELVAPHVLKGLRVSGETAILPSREVALAMQRDGVSRTAGILKVCVSASGGVASVGVVRSTKYGAYDDALVSAARRWRYQPYSVNGAPVAVCGMVTFQYEMK